MSTTTQSSVAYLNGRFQLLERTSVPVQDRGFLFGDGVYEVVPVFAGKPFQLSAHLKRLRNSLKAVGIANPLGEMKWVQIVRDLVEQNGGGDLSVYMQVTRGVAPRNHAFPEKVKPTVFMMAQPLVDEHESFDTEGLKALTTEDFRWKHCSIKSTSLLANVMLKQMAVEQGADEMLLLRNGQLCEGAVSNAFVVQSGEVLTPPLNGDLLPGITRKVVIDLCRQNDVPLRETVVTDRTLQHADEIWVTSSTRGIVPVTTLDGKPVGSGAPGEVWKSVSHLYRKKTGQLAKPKAPMPKAKEEELEIMEIEL